MKQFWSNSKVELIAAEEGKANLEPVPKNGCQKVTQIAQLILVIELGLLLGWAFFSFYQSQHVTLTDVKKDQSRNSALQENFELNQDSPNDSDVITWQEKSIQNKAVDLPSSSEPWSAKIQNVVILESSTASDSVLFNLDSVFHPQTNSPNGTTPPEIEKSTKYFEETTTSSGEPIKNQEDLAAESKILIPIVTGAHVKMIEDIAESSSEIPQLSILVADVDGSSSGVQVFQKEQEQEIRKVLDNSQKDQDFPSPSFIQILHDLDGAKARTAENSLSYGKKYHFQFSMGPETGIQESVENEKSQEVSQRTPFFIRLFFNVSDSDVSPAENVDEFLQAEESVSDPASSPFIDPRFSRQPRTEDSSLDDGTLKWWVNIPEFQQMKVGSLGDEESQPESMILTTAPENEESKEHSWFDSFFNRPDSSSVLPESNEHEYKPNEVLEAQPANSDTSFTAPVSQIFPDAVDLVDQFINKIDEQSSVESNHGYVKGVIPEANEAELTGEMEDLLGALGKINIPFEDRVITDTETKSNFNQEESMKVEEGTVSEENQGSPQMDIAWKNEENWFQFQPTWEEETDGNLNDLFQKSETENYEYEESSKFDLRDYMYDD